MICLRIGGKCLASYFPVLWIVGFTETLFLLYLSNNLSSFLQLSRCAIETFLQLPFSSYCYDCHVLVEETFLFTSSILA